MTTTCAKIVTTVRARLVRRCVRASSGGPRDDDACVRARVIASRHAYMAYLCPARTHTARERSYRARDPRRASCVRASCVRACVRVCTLRCVCVDAPVVRRARGRRARGARGGSRGAREARARARAKDAKDGGRKAEGARVLLAM